MTTFEDLQKSWQSQPVAPAGATDALMVSLEKKWQHQQSGVLRSNVITTLGFTFTFIVFGWVYFSFHQGRTIFFGGSILFMVALMAVYLWILWKGYSFKKVGTDVMSNEFIQHSLERLLWRRKTTTTYVAIYTVLLWMALMCYFFDVLAGASLKMQIGASVATTVYIFGVFVISWHTKTKKQLKKTDELIAGLRKLQAENAL